MRTLILSSLVTLLGLSLIAVSHPALAQKSKSGANKKLSLDKLENPAPSAPGTADSAPSKKFEKVDISDLEQKYWAPKDTDFNVVQNRTYSKEKRFSVSLQYGPVVNDTFSSGFTTGLSANYFMSERYGLQLEYMKPALDNSSATNNFISNVGGFAGAAPDFGRITQYYGVGFNWVPVYAKMSLLGSRIIYFDMAITPTVGMMSYKQIVGPSAVEPSDKSSFSYGVDITQYFFVHRNWAIRADLKNRWFQEDILKWNNATPLRTETTNTTLFLLGLTYYF